MTNLWLYFCKQVTRVLTRCLYTLLLMRAKLSYIWSHFSGSEICGEKRKYCVNVTFYQQFKYQQWHLLCYSTATDYY